MFAKRFKPSGGIARKLIVAIVASLFVSFVVTTAVSTWIELRRQAHVETDRLTQTARVIASLSAEAVRAEDRAGAFVAIRSTGQMPDVSYARLEGRSGLLAETGGGTRLLTDAQLGPSDRSLSLWRILRTGSIQVTVPVMSEGETVGSVVLFSRAPDLKSRIFSTAWTTVAGALVAVIAGSLVALRMADRISRPIVTLAALVRRIHGTKDFSGRIDVESEGEVADLVEGFDTLLTGIQERDARIAAHVESLEDEVAARTQDLVVARDAAEQANAAKSDFLAVMSHEIRTPLNGILALSEMLALSELPQRQQRYANVISKSGKSLLSIINDILDFSKVEAGKMDLETIDVDLSEAAEDVASLFAAKADEKGLDLAVFVDPRLPIVSADPTRLRQVIGNLVNNAIKFTEKGGVLIDISPVEGGVRFAIEDTGPGIPADRLPTLFEAFTQVDQTTTRKYGGTGLGLAICDRLVRSMSGTWDLSSVVGEGSTFAFVVPLQECRPAADPVVFAPGFAVRLTGLAGPTASAMRRILASVGVAVSDDAEAGLVAPGAPRPRLAAVVCANETEAEAVARDNPDVGALVRPLRRSEVLHVLHQMQKGETPRLGEIGRTEVAGQIFPGARVLVVDDSEVNREVASEALTRLAVTVDLACDGLEAIERLRGRTYDMVLMDGSMPELDGFEATRRIRAEEERTGRPRAVIIALTAHVVGAGAKAWIESGMDGVIHKPFALSDLARELGRHCAGLAASGVAAGGSLPVAVETDVDLLDPAVRAELLSMKRAGRVEFFDRVHTLYARNAPEKFTAMRAAAEAGDAAAVGRAAHALRSMSLSLGAVGVAQGTQEIERIADEGGVARDAIEALSTTLRATLAALAEDSAPVIEKTLGEALSDAIAEGHLFLLYQPLVDRQGAPAQKVEGLVRWLDPVEGLRSPDTFIPQLEAEGAIQTLTDFVLTRAMEDMIDRGPLKVSVNASAQEFQAPGFARRVGDAVKAANFPVDRLEIEVTETAMLDVSAAASTLRDLQALGVSVALDDFGAGFTSLHALRELPFNTLKIDRSFVERCTADTSSAAIIHAVIGVGRALGMTVVCEGVETAEQADFLRIAGVHLMQGYHFHRPMRLDDFPMTTARAA